MQSESQNCLSILFEETVKSKFQNELKNNSITINPNSVPDQFVASIEIELDICGGHLIYQEQELYDEKTDFWDRRMRIDDTLSKANLPTITLVLESPHIAEFLSNNKSSPAMGITGKILKDYFLKELSFFLFNQYLAQGDYISNKRLISNGIYRLRLVNAIQYQCSLGVQKSQFTEPIFLRCWRNKKFRSDFIERLKRYVPTVIINCCTGQQNGIICGLQKEVQQTIDANFPFSIRLYGYHPSTHHFLRGLKLCP